MLRFLVIILLCIVACHAIHKPKVLLISFDGFRWNYLSRTATPNFDRLISGGVKAKWTQDVFVTQTFPNHYTLATGLYEESHGIVANRFFDPKLNVFFNYHSKKDVGNATFWDGEPIWVTNQLQGGETGVLFWVGSEAPIKNVRPTAWMPYSMNYPWHKRVDMIVDWLANKPTGKKQTQLNINLALLYFPQPDHDGHLYGPESPEVTKMIGQCDNITGYLLDKLEENGLFDEVNIIITSDHGMATLNQSRTVPILPHMNVSHVDHIINYGTGAAVWPKEGFMESVYESLLHIGPHAKVWRKEDIPPQFHYTENRRVPPILIMPRDEWFLVNLTTDKIYMNGSHGYNNSLPDMHPFFIAHGPAFREKFVSEPFSSVNVYPLICHILGLNPAPNNGSLCAVQHLLRSSVVHHNITYNYAAKVVGVIIGFVLAILVVVFVLKHFSDGRHKYFSIVKRREVDVHGDSDALLNEQL